MSLPLNVCFEHDSPCMILTWFVSITPHWLWPKKLHIMWEVAKSTQIIFLNEIQSWCFDSIACAQILGFN